MLYLCEYNIENQISRFNYCNLFGYRGWANIEISLSNIGYRGWANAQYM